MTLFVVLYLSTNKDFLKLHSKVKTARKFNEFQSSLESPVERYNNALSWSLDSSASKSAQNRQTVALADNNKLINSQIKQGVGPAKVGPVGFCFSALNAIFYFSFL